MSQRQDGAEPIAAVPCPPGGVRELKAQATLAGLRWPLMCAVARDGQVTMPGTNGHRLAIPAPMLDVLVELATAYLVLQPHGGRFYLGDSGAFLTSSRKRRFARFTPPLPATWPATPWEPESIDLPEDVTIGVPQVAYDLPSTAARPEPFYRPTGAQAQRGRSTPKARKGTQAPGSGWAHLFGSTEELAWLFVATMLWTLLVVAAAALTATSATPR